MKFSALISPRTLLLALALCIGGCGNFTIFPGVHKIGIYQGNIIDQEMVDKLKIGMTRAQVSFVLGTPLVADPFNQNQWSYFYSKKDPDGNIDSRSFNVLFENNELASFEGDVAPPRFPTEVADQDTEEEDGNKTEESSPSSR